MSAVFDAAERTEWLGGRRIRRYNPTLALLGVLGLIAPALPVVLLNPDRLWPIAMLLVFAALGALVLLGRRATRGVRLNNDAVALITRGEEARAAEPLRAAVSGFFGRDVVGMSLYNLGIVALRSLDLSGAIALYRAAIAAGEGFRFRWQSDLAADFSRAQLAFALAASGEDVDHAAAVLETAKQATAPVAIAYAARARAMLAVRRGRFEEVTEILDGERALLRNVLPLNDAVLCEAMGAYALARQGNIYRGATRPSQPVLADDLARAYVRRMLPEAETVLVSV